MTATARIACEIIHTEPETGVQRECGKDAAGYSASGVAVCAECEDDDTLQIVEFICPRCDHRHGMDPDAFHDMEVRL